MKELNESEMLSVKAGGISAGMIAVIGGCIAFIVGILDGYTRPFRCR